MPKTPSAAKRARTSRPSTSTATPPTSTAPAPLPNSVSAPSASPSLAIFQYSRLQLTRSHSLRRPLRHGPRAGRLHLRGAESAPRNSQRNGFAVDAEGRLAFERTRWWACPTGLGDGSYGIWLNKGSDKCVGFVFRVEYTEAPVGCLYSHRPAYEAMLPAEGFWEP